MHRVTARDVKEKYNGVLPPDAVLVPSIEDDPAAAIRPQRRNNSQKPSSGRFQLLNAFIDFTLRDLTRTEMSVWFIVFRDVKAETGTARVSQANLAERAGVTVRAVQIALKSLATKGLLKRLVKGRIGSGSSVYQVRCPQKG